MRHASAWVVGVLQETDLLKAKQTPRDHVAEVRDLMISTRANGADTVKFHSRTHSLSAKLSAFSRGLICPTSLTPPSGHAEARVFFSDPLAHGCLQDRITFDWALDTHCRPG